jgi:hypothetical protein
MRRLRLLARIRGGIWSSAMAIMVMAMILFRSVLLLLVCLSALGCLALILILLRTLQRSSSSPSSYLESLKAECEKHGTVLIFDEIITGFRFPGLTVSKYFGIEPDLILLGKAIGGGLPLSAIGGKKAVMNCGEYFISGTFFGETVSLAACMETINLLKKDGTKYSIDELWKSGQQFLDRFNELSPHLKIVGYPTRGVFEGSDLVKALFWQEACKAGILFGPSWFFNFPLASETDAVIPICRDIFSRIHLGGVRLEGQMPKKPFAQTVRSENGSRT